MNKDERLVELTDEFEDWASSGYEDEGCIRDECDEILETVKEEKLEIEFFDLLLEQMKNSDGWHVAELFHVSEKLNLNLNISAS